MRCWMRVSQSRSEKKDLGRGNQVNAYSDACVD